MAKMKMKKIELAALWTDSKKILERLQRRGVVELSDCQDEALIKMNTSSIISQFEKHRASAVSACELLHRYDSEKKPLLSFLSGRREIEKHDFGKLADRADEWLRICYAITSAGKEIEDNRAAVSRLTLQIDALSVWETLDIPQNFAGTQSTACFIGTLPGAVTKESIESLSQEDTHTKYGISAEIIDSFRNQTCLAVFCHKEDADELYAFLRSRGFMLPSDPSALVPDSQIQEWQTQIEELQKKSEDAKERICSYRKDLPQLEFLIDYFTMRRQKYEAIEQLGATQKTFILSGYIPAAYADKLQKELEARFDIAVSLSDPEKDDDVPVLLHNGWFSSPVESITEMYSLPGPRDVDPNPVMAFFYYLFFGLMLSDAGYGVIMVIVTALILRRTTVEGPLRRSLKMFFYCGISTTIWGALFGSWFGDIVQVVAREFFGKEISSLALWFEPIKDPIRMLLFSFALGIAHLFLGLGVNFYMSWRDGNKLDAICDVIPIYITVLGAMPLGASVLTTVPAALTTVGKYFLLCGAILIILTAGRSSKSIPMRFFGGIYGLYNIATGYLSDVLSYSRLLALGLATGSIAGVINLIGTMPQNPVIKAIFLIIVFCVAHPANMAVNMLGAYVHSDRLQFVELFSKFYEGGGRPFNPLRADTKYIRFKEEN